MSTDDSIIICPADEGNTAVVKDRETNLPKMQDHYKGNYEFSKKDDQTILSRLHHKKVDQLVAMGIDD